MRTSGPLDSFEVLLLNVLRDVQLARRLNSKTPEGRGAWDRAANSLKALAQYCDQRRDARP